MGFTSITSSSVTALAGNLGPVSHADKYILDIPEPLHWSFTLYLTVYFHLALALSLKIRDPTSIYGSRALTHVLFYLLN